MSEEKSNRLILGKSTLVRFSFLNVFRPVESEEDGEKKSFYQTSVLIPKSSKADIAAFNEHVKAVIDAEFKGKSTNLKLPLRDGDEEWEEKGAAYKDHYFFNCKSKHKPDVVGTKRDEFTGDLAALGQDEIKSGDHGRIAVTFYAFEGKQKGIAVGLGNVQKVRDGEPLGNQRAANDDFGDIEDGFSD